MSINNLNLPNTTASANSVTGTTDAAPANSSKKVADRDTFLTLLVAQLKNQDPLAPQDGAAFVAQLAQFNSLDQLININDQLGKLLKK